MSKSMISVVLPVYNVAAYIEKCILSLLNQTYKNFEIILVDDCSPDNSIDIALRILSENQFTNYQLIRHIVNGGAAAGRNTGLQAAKGEYLYFMDNDDYVEKTLLAEMVEVLDTQDVDIVVCNYCREFILTGKRDINFTSPFKGRTEPAKALEALFTEREHAYIWRNLYKKEIFAAVRFAENVVFEDMMTLPLLWAHAKAIYFIPPVLYVYIQREGSVMTTWNSADRFLEITKYMKRNEEFFEKHSQLKFLKRRVQVYHYTMLRNFILLLSQDGKGFDYYKILFNSFRMHVKLPALLRLPLPKNLQLIYQLSVLKLSSYLVWKKFRTV